MVEDRKQLSNSRLQRVICLDILRIVLVVGEGNVVFGILEDRVGLVEVHDRFVAFIIHISIGLGEEVGSEI